VIKPELNIIRMKNAVFYAYHGVMQDEQNLGGKFECDVELHCDFSSAAQSDTLKNTVDYERVYTFIQSTVLERKYYLLEALANAIGQGSSGNSSTWRGCSCVSANPIPGERVVDFVEVEVTHTR